MSTDSFEEMVAAYRGWHGLESRRGGPAILDFDLAPPGMPARDFESRVDVLAALEDLAGRLPSSHPFLIDRVLASCASLRALLGQQIPFPSFISKTLLLDAVPIPQEAVERQRGEVTRILERNGLDFEPKSRAAVAKRFETDNRDQDLCEWLRIGAEREARRAMQALAPEVSLEFTCAFTESPSYWKGWATARAGEHTRVYYNLTPRNPYLRGEAFLLAHHEVAGHALQMECWRNRIARGELNPAYGLTVVHSFEQFIYEGIAQVVTDLVFRNEELDDDTLWAREYSRYRTYVYQRAHLDMNMGIDVNVVVRDLQTSLPFENFAEMETELRSRCLDPILRGYQFIYAASDYSFLSALRTLGKARFLGLVRNLYASPQTMDQVMSALGQSEFRAAAITNS